MRLPLLMLLIAMLLPWSAPRAQDSQPPIYLFYSASCPYSQAMRTLLQSVRREDAALRIREFEVDASPANMALLAQVYQRIGMADLLIVPLVVIGSDAIIGYADEATTRAEILAAIAECRQKGCSDGLRDLVDGRRLEEAAAGGPPPACSAQPFSPLETLGG